MASYSVRSGVHKTLTSTTADVITLTKRWREVIITNYDGTNKLYVTFDGTTPVALADNTYVVPANSWKSFRFRNTVQTVSVVGNAGAYSVEGF